MLGTSGTFASDICVTDPDGLNAALAQASSSAESDTIRLVKGIYQIASDLNYFAGSIDSGDLLLAGGFDSPSCDPSTLDLGAHETVLEASSAASLIVMLEVDAGRTLAISDLSMLGFLHVGLYASMADNAAGSVWVRRTVVATDVSPYGSLIAIHGGDVAIQNSLFAGNPVMATLDVGRVSDNGVLALHHATVVNSNQSWGWAVWLNDFSISDTSPVIENSVLASAGGPDLYTTRSPASIVSSAFSNAAGCTNNPQCSYPGPVLPDSTDNQSGEPWFAGVGEVYTRYAPAPEVANPLIDSAAGLAWDHDVLGNPRVVGNAADRGAFEVQLVMGIFGDGFEP